MSILASTFDLLSLSSKMFGVPHRISNPKESSESRMSSKSSFKGHDESQTQGHAQANMFSTPEHASPQPSNFERELKQKEVGSCRDLPHSDSGRGGWDPASSSSILLPSMQCRRE